MKASQRSLVAVVVVVGIAILACSPVGGGAATKNTPVPVATAGSQAGAASATPSSGAQATAAGAEATATGAEATASGAEATETSSPTYDAVAAQLTVPALLTANAATATAASGTLHQWAAAAVASSQYGDTDWAATQATGAPDSPTDCGDQKTAWASAGNGGTDNIELVYTTTVVPVAVNIYETNKPGAIVKVDVEEGNGTAHTVYSGLPLPTKDCPRIFTVGISGLSAHVNRVKIYLDQSVTKTWDEIDAVELVGNP